MGGAKRKASLNESGSKLRREKRFKKSKENRKGKRFFRIRAGHAQMEKKNRLSKNESERAK